MTPAGSGPTINQFISVEANTAPEAEAAVRRMLPEIERSAVRAVNESVRRRDPRTADIQGAR